MLAFLAVISSSAEGNSLAVAVLLDPVSWVGFPFVLVVISVLLLSAAPSVRLASRLAARSRGDGFRISLNPLGLATKKKVAWPVTGVFEVVISPNVLPVSAAGCVVWRGGDLVLIWAHWDGLRVYWEWTPGVLVGFDPGCGAGKAL